MSHTSIYIEDASGHQRIIPQLHGTDGDLQTAHILRDMVRETCGLDGYRLDVALRDFAHNIVIAWYARNGITDYTSHNHLQAIFDYVQKQFIYMPDALGGNEQIAWPREVIRTGIDDCDGHLVLLATLAALIGLSSELVIAYFDGPNGERLGHIYPRVSLPDGAVVVADATNKRQPLGWELPARERISIPVFEGFAEAQGIAGFGSFLKTALGVGSVVAAPFTGGASLAIQAAVAGAGAASGLIGQAQASGAAKKALSTSRDVAKEQVYTELETLRDKVSNDEIVGNEALTQAHGLVTQYLAMGFPGGQNFQSGFDLRIKQIEDKAAEQSERIKAAKAQQVVTPEVLPPANTYPVPTGAGISEQTVLAAAAIVGGLYVFGRLLSNNG